MNKRNIRPNNKEFDVESGSDSHDLLQIIQRKLEKSAALNGGFDKLLYKIDGIENSQSQIVEKVDKIHEAIYHPDDGLFARINANKAEQVETVSKLERQVVEIASFQQIQKKSAEHVEEENDNFSKKIQHLENSLENIRQTRATLFSITKWFGAALGGGAVTLIFKVIYEALNLKH